jgi:hypothetical protein
MHPDVRTAIGVHGGREYGLGTLAPQLYEHGLVCTRELTRGKHCLDKDVRPPSVLEPRCPAKLGWVQKFEGTDRNGIIKVQVNQPAPAEYHTDVLAVGEGPPYPFFAEVDIGPVVQDRRLAAHWGYDIATTLQF